MGILLIGAACSSDERTPDVDSRSIRFAGSPVTHVDGETRAVVNGNYLPKGDEVGIFAHYYPVSSTAAWQTNPNLFDNVKGTVGDIPSSGAQTITLPENKYYKTGQKHAFYSYYPHRTLTAAAPEWTSDLFAKSGDTQTDWLWATPVTDFMSSVNPVQFTYLHTMSLIRVTAAKHQDVKATLQMESITVGTSTSQKFKFNVSTGVITNVSGGETGYTAASLSELATTPATASEILLLPASAVTSISFRVNGEDFTTPSDWGGFTTSTAGGKYKLINITVNVNEIVIQLGGQDWTPGEDIDLSQSEVSISLGAKEWEYDPATDIDIRQSKTSISLGAKDWIDHGTAITATKKS